MTPQDLKDFRARLGWSREELARRDRKIDPVHGGMVAVSLDDIGHIEECVAHDILPPPVRLQGRAQIR